MCLMIAFSLFSSLANMRTHEFESQIWVANQQTSKTRGKPRSKLCCKSGVVTSLVQFLISPISLNPLQPGVDMSLLHTAAMHCMPSSLALSFPGRRGTGKFLCTWIKKISVSIKLKIYWWNIRGGHVASPFI